MPNGIVMIRMNARIPARKYKIAIHQPHSRNQMTFSMSLMTDYYPLLIDHKLELWLGLGRVLVCVLVSVLVLVQLEMVVQLGWRRLVEAWMT